MSDPFDIIAVPGQPGHYGRRAFVDALVRAGNPPLNSSLRLTDEQQRAWDAYQAGTGSPADDPSRPNLFPLAHVRGVAGDITPTPSRVAALASQGLVRPYDYEPWHWQLPGNVRIYPLVDRIPAPAGASTGELTPKKARSAMATLYVNNSTTPPTFALAGDGEGEAGWLEFTDQQLANNLAGFHGISQSAVPLGDTSFREWGAKYRGEAG